MSAILTYMENTHLAYLAGIVDGEGSIELVLFKKTTLNLRLHVYNSDRPLFDWIEAHFGGKTYDIHRKARVEKPQWAPVYSWQLQGQRACDLLSLLLPFMVVNVAQAKLAIEAWNARQPVPLAKRGYTGRARPSDAVIAIRHAFVHQMHQLNTKNRGKGAQAP